MKIKVMYQIPMSLLEEMVSEIRGHAVKLGHVLRGEANEPHKCRELWFTYEGNTEDTKAP